MAKTKKVFRDRLIDEIEEQQEQTSNVYDGLVCWFNDFGHELMENPDGIPTLIKLTNQYADECARLNDLQRMLKIYDGKE